ncbi:MAG: aldo/keto reductase [Gammaproteobacteria bacterium]|nr:aldo/keto reductase [Gammaproteobacteria bacterium]
MNVSHAYGAPLSDDEAVALFRDAFDAGYRHFDTATLYGAGYNETLVGQAIKPFRHEIFLASKCGNAIDPETRVQLINGRPEVIKAQCDASLKRLGVDHMDLYYLHRRDFAVPIEESVGALGDLVKAGKIGGIGLSEVSADTIRRAHAEHPLMAVQSEYSVWTRNVEIGVKSVCASLGIALVAFSPVARGFLGNAVHALEALDEKDIRRGMPRFQSPNFEANLAWLGDYVALAESLSLTPAQLAIAWLNAQGEHVLPLPGTRQLSKATENLVAAQRALSVDEVAAVDQIVTPEVVKGPRYSPKQQATVDTETFEYEA